MSVCTDSTVNVLDLCRLCLGKDRKLTSVFENNELWTTDCQLTDKINLCLDVQISESDKVSQQICHDCLTKIDSFYEFRNITANSQKLLESWLSESQKRVQHLPDEATEEENQSVDCEFDPLETIDEEDIDVNSEKSDYSEIQSQIVPKKDLAEPSSSQTQSSTLVEYSGNCLKKEEKIDINCKGKKLFRCEYCGDAFTRFKFEMHQRKHTGERPFKCTEPGCSWAFATNGMLAAHRRVHEGRRPHVCNVCGSRFKTQTHLSNHAKIHTGRREYLCDLCDYSCLYKATLVLHRKRHLKQYIAICEMCGKGFYNRSDLKEHISGHTGDTPFTCDQCGLAFPNKYHLRKHKNAHVSSAPTQSIQCEKCSKICSDRRSYINHLRRVHSGKKYECEICGKFVVTKSYLTEHMRVHSGEKPFLCKICGKAFSGRKSIRVHEVVHTGEKKYECEICNKRFTQKSSLNAHKKLHN